MEKRKSYIAPFAKIVLFAPLLSDNSYSDDTGMVGFGSGALDAGMGQAKENYSDDNAQDWHSLWDD